MKQEIIQPIEKSLLRQEISTLTKLCDSLHGGYELYVFTSHQCPNLMQELGRLKQIAYRGNDIGTNDPIYADEFDFMENPYRQMIVWDDKTSSILGSYRIAFGADIKILDDGTPHMWTCGLFDLSERFVRECLPYTTEWGRAFVANDYQVTGGGAAASMFVLTSLWDGLAAILRTNPQIKYILGNATIPCNTPSELTDLISAFTQKYYPTNGLGTPKRPWKMRMTEGQAAEIISADSKKEALRKMKAYLKSIGTQIPPLLNSYLATSPNLRCFGISENLEYSEYMVGIFEEVEGINQDKWNKHFRDERRKREDENRPH